MKVRFTQFASRPCSVFHHSLGELRGHPVGRGSSIVMGSLIFMGSSDMQIFVGNIFERVLIYKRVERKGAKFETNHVSVCQREGSLQRGGENGGPIEGGSHRLRACKFKFGCVVGQPVVFVVH